MFNLGPELYSPIYYAVVGFLSFLVFFQYDNYSNDRFYDPQRQPVLGICLFTLLLAIFIGLRPVSKEFFVDMDLYDAVYNLVRGREFIFHTEAGTNLIFDNLFYYFASREIPSTYFFLLISIIYFTGISWACSLLFPRDRMASILVYLAAFSTYAYGTNGIKAGAAASVFLVAVALYQKRKWLGVVLLMLVSLGIHHAMILPIGAFLVCLVIKNPKLVFAFWVISFFLSLFHVTFFQELLASIVDEQGAGYLLGAGGHTKVEIFGGFRIDFIIYSVVPIVVGLIAIEKHKIESESYFFLLNLYTIINAVWLLCMYSDFTNRIAYLSWMLFPIVLIYPFLNEEWEGPKYKIFQWVAYGHLVYNLFMVLIYW